MATSASPENAWSRYWEKGFLTTFSAESGENYSGEIQTHWEAVFASLKDRDRVIDLGTGNGALLSLLAEYADRENLELDLVGVDSADIDGDAGAFAAHPHIRLLANTSLTETGLAVSSVHLAISQFGFEYAPTGAGCAELARLLAPGGRFHALVHHDESEIAAMSRTAIDQIDLCDRSKLIDITRKLLVRLKKLEKSGRDKKTDAKADRLRNEFNRVAQRVNEYADRLPDDSHVTYFLGELAGVFSPAAKSFSWRKKIEIVDQVAAESAAYRARMVAMLEACRDQDEIQVTVEQLAKYNLSPERPKVLLKNKQPFAWIVSACT